MDIGLDVEYPGRSVSFLDMYIYNPTYNVDFVQVLQVDAPSPEACVYLSVNSYISQKETSNNQWGRQTSKKNQAQTKREGEDETEAIEMGMNIWTSHSRSG